MTPTTRLLRATPLLLLFAAPVALVAGATAADQARSSQGVVLKGRAPVSDEVLTIRLPRPQEADLANGLHLIVLEDHRVPQVSMQLLVPGAGGYFDPADATGLGSFTALMMSEGTTTRTAQQIAQEQETMASVVTVNTSNQGESATLFLHCLAENFDRTMALAADVILNPSFPEAELARGRTRQKAQLTQLRAAPSLLATERYNRVIYGDHPHGRVLTSLAAIDAMTRDTLVAFHKARYVPDHAVAAIVGDTTLAAARASLERAFATWQKAGVTAPAVQDPLPVGARRVHLVHRPNSVQTTLVVGTQAIPRASPDYDALLLLNEILGGGPTARIFLNLREDKGWTYNVSGTLATPRCRGDWSVQTDVKGDVTEQAVAEILGELDRVRTEPIPDNEFRDRQRMLVSRFALSLEAPMTILTNYVLLRRYGLPSDYWDTYPERILAVTREQVQDAARRYLDPSRLHIVAVGDAARIGGGLARFGTVDTYDSDGRLKRP